MNTGVFIISKIRFKGIRAYNSAFFNNAKCLCSFSIVFVFGNPTIKFLMKNRSSVGNSIKSLLGKTFFNSHRINLSFHNYHQYAKSLNKSTTNVFASSLLKIISMTSKMNKRIIKYVFASLFLHGNLFTYIGVKCFVVKSNEPEQRLGLHNNLPTSVIF